MTPQEIDDQLELLRLKELFMSGIDIRSKMAMLICSDQESTNPPYKDFCELTHCSISVARKFAQILVIDVMLTHEEIAAERERLERMKL